METPPPISFARGAPSLDIVAVDELSAAAGRAFQNDPGGTTAYGTSIGYVPLREWIAEYQQVTPEQVMVTNGSMQADAFLFRRLVEPGDVVTAVAASRGKEPLQIAAQGGYQGETSAPYLSVDLGEMRAAYLRRPERREVPVICAEQLVVEFYSR